MSVPAHPSSLWHAPNALKEKPEDLLWLERKHRDCYHCETTGSFEYLLGKLSRDLVRYK